MRSFDLHPTNLTLAIKLFIAKNIYKLANPIVMAVFVIVATTLLSTSLIKDNKIKFKEFVLSEKSMSVTSVKSKKKISLIPKPSHTKVLK